MGQGYSYNTTVSFSVRSAPLHPSRRAFSTVVKYEESHLTDLEHWSHGARTILRGLRLYMTSIRQHFSQMDDENYFSPYSPHCWKSVNSSANRR